MITTVGELKKKLEGLRDNLPLEFWLLEPHTPFSMVTVEHGDGIRTPGGQVVEIILKFAE